MMEKKAKHFVFFNRTPNLWAGVAKKKKNIQHKQEVNRDFNRCAIIYLLSQAIFLVRERALKKSL